MYCIIANQPKDHLLLISYLLPEFFVLTSAMILLLPCFLTFCCCIPSIPTPLQIYHKLKSSQLLQQNIIPYGGKLWRIWRMTTIPQI